MRPLLSFLVLPLLAAPVLAQKPKPGGGGSDSKPVAPAPRPVSTPAPAPAPRPVSTPAPAPAPRPVASPPPSRPMAQPTPQPSPQPRSYPQPSPRSQPTDVGNPGRTSRPIAQPTPQPAPRPTYTPPPRSIGGGRSLEPAVPGSNRGSVAQPQPIGGTGRSQPSRPVDTAPPAVGGAVRPIGGGYRAPSQTDAGDKPMPSDRPVTQRHVVDRYSPKPVPTDADAPGRPVARAPEPARPVAAPTPTVRPIADHRYAPPDVTPSGNNPRGSLQPRRDAEPRQRSNLRDAIVREAPHTPAPRLRSHMSYGDSYGMAHNHGRMRCWDPCWDPCWGPSWTSGFSFGFGWSSACWWSTWYPYHYYRTNCWYDDWYWGWGRSRWSSCSYWWWPETVYCPTYLYAEPAPSTVIVYEQPMAPTAEPVVIGTAPRLAERTMTPAEMAEKYVSLGDFYFREGRFAEAVDAYSRARTYAPEDPTIDFVLADAAFATGDYHFAAYLIGEALRLDPTLARADTDKRLFYNDVKVFEKQMETLQAYVAEKRYDAMAVLVLGYNLKFSARPAEARKAFERVLEIDPASTAAKTFLFALTEPPAKKDN